MNRMNLAAMLMTVGVSTAWSAADVIVSQQPVAGGGVSRWSQLWQDPGPNGNDLDGDSVCWADFTLTAPASLNHIEWWGAGACELGFRIEIWKQDPGTIAYQPLGVFYYGGNHSITPEFRFDTTTATTSPGPGGIVHYALDLPTPISLPANSQTNPRWFIAIIGLTHQAYYTWNWAQGTGGSNHTFQFIRGEGPQFRILPEGRALSISTTGQSCYANCDGSTGSPALSANDFQCFLNLFASGSPGANCDGSIGSPTLTANDFQCFINAYAIGCS
jgi:hypothetical protein